MTEGRYERKQMNNNDGMSYTFTLNDLDPNESDSDLAVRRKITHSVKGEQTWDELLAHFEDWLRDCGYVFDGHVRMVEDELTYAGENEGSECD